MNGLPTLARMHTHAHLHAHKHPHKHARVQRMSVLMGTRTYAHALPARERACARRGRGRAFSCCRLHVAMHGKAAVAQVLIINITAALGLFSLARLVVEFTLEFLLNRRLK